MIIIILCFTAFYFQLCKIIIAKFTVKLNFSYQKNKEDNSSLLCITFFSDKTDMFLLIIRSS